MLGYLRLFLTMLVLLRHTALSPNALGHSALASFFLISGFGMSLTLSANYGHRPLPYYWNRIIRIYPLHILTTAAILLIGATGWSQYVNTKLFSFSNITGSLLLLTGMPDFNNPAWTLGYEIVFYLYVPLVMLHPALRWIGLAGTAALLCLYGHAEWIILPFSHATETHLHAALFFFLGMCLFTLNQKIAPKSRPALAFITPRALLTLGIAISLLSIRNVFYQDFEWFDNVFYLTGHAVISLITIPILLTWGQKESRGSVFSGDICYPIYLFHHPIHNMLIRHPTVDPFFRTLKNSLGGGELTYLLLQTAATITLTIVLSILWLKFEKHTFKKMRWRGHDRTKITVSATAIPEIPEPKKAAAAFS